MKKYLYLSISIFLLSEIGFAQTFSIGTRNGISHTSISGRFDYKNFEDAQIRYNSVIIWGERWNISKFKASSSGYLKQMFGFILNCQFNKNISLQSEFNYEEKGFDFHYVLYGGGLRGFYETQYFTIPVSFVYEIGKSVKYYGYGGISMGFLLQAANYTTTSNTASPNPIYYDESYRPTEFNKKELGALTGIGMKIPLSDKVKFIIETRYNFGITKAAKNRDYNYTSNPNTYDTPNNFQNVFNRSISLCWGVIYRISKESK